MVKGLKATSSQVVISSSVTETGPNVFTNTSIDLQLNVLDREVFVVTAIDLDVASPDAVAAVNTSSNMSISTTARTTMGQLSDTNVMGVALSSIRAAGFVDGGVGFQSLHPDSPTAEGLSYVAVIATNDFHLQIQGGGNLVAKEGHARLWGYRAVADAATFAALTQSELLSQ